MSNKYYILIGVVLLAGGYYIGRATTPTKIETKTITVEVEKKHEDTKTNEVKVEVIKPDGTKTITTHTNIETKTDSTKTDNTKSQTVVQNKHSSTNINIFAGVDIFNPKLVYGAHISRDIFGPISIGIFGFTNGLAGASVGLSF